MSRFRRSQSGQGAVVIVTVLALVMSFYIIGLSGGMRFYSKDKARAESTRFQRDVTNNVTEMLASFTKAKILKRVAVLHQPTKWVMNGMDANSTFALTQNADGSAKLDMTICDPRHLSPTDLFGNAPANALPDACPSDGFPPANPPRACPPKTCAHQIPVHVTLPKIPDDSWNVDVKLNLDPVTDNGWDPADGLRFALAVGGKLVGETEAHAEGKAPFFAGRAHLAADPPEPLCDLAPKPGSERISVFGNTDHGTATLELKWAGKAWTSTIRNLSVLDVSGNPEVVYTADDPNQTQVAPLNDPQGMDGDGDQGTFKYVPGRTPNTGPVVSPQVNIFEATIKGPGGIGRCRTSIKVVPLPKCSITASRCPGANTCTMDYDQTDTITVRFQFPDFDPSDTAGGNPVQWAEVYRTPTTNQVAVPGNDNSLTYNEPGNPTLAHAVYAGYAEGFGGKIGTQVDLQIGTNFTYRRRNAGRVTSYSQNNFGAACTLDFGIKAKVDLAWSPNAVFLTQNSMLSYTPHGPWYEDTTNLPLGLTGYGTGSWHVNGPAYALNLPNGSNPADVAIDSRVTPLSQSYQAAPASVLPAPSYTLDATASITNWAGTNYAGPVSLAVAVPGTPACQINYTSGRTLISAPSRFQPGVPQQAPVSLALVLTPPANQPIIAKSIAWDGRPASNGDVNPPPDDGHGNTNGIYPWEDTTSTAQAKSVKDGNGNYVYPNENPAFNLVETVTSNCSVQGFDSATPFNGSRNVPIECIMYPVGADTGLPADRDGRDVIRRIYYSVLGRNYPGSYTFTVPTVNNDEIDYWMRAFAAGSTVNDLKGAIRSSAEYNAAGGPDREYVVALYRLYLGRPPSPCRDMTVTGANQCEEKFWVDQLAGATDQTRPGILANIAAGIAGSAEAQARGGLFHTEPLDEIYLDYLSRTCSGNFECDDPTQWPSLIWAGWAIPSIPGRNNPSLEGAIQSSDQNSPYVAQYANEEYLVRGGLAGKIVGNMYQGLLGRMGETGGLSYWVAQVSRTTSFLNGDYAAIAQYLAQAFRSSAEYRSLGGCALPEPAPLPADCPFLTGTTVPVATPWTSEDSLDRFRQGGGFNFDKIWHLGQVDFGYNLVENSAQFPGYQIVSQPIAYMPSDGVQFTVRGDYWNYGPGAGASLVNNSDYSMHYAASPFGGCPAGSACFMELTKYQYGNPDSYHDAMMWLQVDHWPNADCQLSRIVYRIRGCFAPETSIAMADGSSRRADAIREGDLLWNPALRKPAHVVEVTAGPEKERLVELGYGAQLVRVTRHHPIPTRRGIVFAENVALGDRIRGEDGVWHAVTIRRDAPGQDGQWVWNFAFDGDAETPDKHMILANGLVTGDLVLQRKGEKGYTP